MTWDLKAKLYMDNSDYERRLRKSAKQLEGFGKTTKSISNAVKAAWVGIATLGGSAVVEALIDVTKAAAEERKSVALLNGALDKNWHATDKTKEAVADFITKQQNLSGILDDKLRPAFAKIALVVKKPEKAMKSFALAMDVSAGTGKDLNTVSQAFAKFLGGNKNALDKLIPGLKDAGDKMGFLQAKYGGMAAVAGSNDPFARINVVMEDFKEKLGTAFLPVIDKFAEWLTSEDAQNALDDLAKKVQEFGDWFLSPEGQKTFDGWMDDLKALIKLAGDFLNLVGETAALLNSSGKDRKAGNDAPASNIYTGSTVKTTGLGDTAVVNQLHNIVYGAIKDLKLDPVSSLKAIPLGGGVTVNVDVKSDPITGKSIVKVLKQEASTRGTTVGRVLG